MEILCKVRHTRPIGHQRHAKGWCDGQIIDIREDGAFQHSILDRVNHCVIRTQHDFWDVRGSRDWKSTIKKVFDLKKYLLPVDSRGKYSWESGSVAEEIRASYDLSDVIVAEWPRVRMRDWFVDYKRLLDDGLISDSDFESIYSVEHPHNNIFIDCDFTSYIQHEDVGIRRTSKYSEEINKRFISTDGAGSGTNGGFTIGAAGDYATVTAFFAAIDAALTGDLHGLHLDEETVIDAEITPDTDTSTHTLTLTAETSCEHSGIFGNATHQAGDGARINCTAGDGLYIQEGGAGELDNIVISKLVMDITGSNNSGIHFYNGGDAGLMLADRMVIKGNADSTWGIYLGYYLTNGKVTNCILYDIGNGAGDGGIRLYGPPSSGRTFTVYNNTCISCYDNIIQENGTCAGTVVLKNNIAQADSGGADYRDDGGGFGTHAYNISEDATSPDAAYQSKDLHTNSVFQNYGSDDFRLDSEGDSTNLAIVDDGENLYGSGVTEDIQGQTRDNGTPFWIGASHIPAGGDPSASESHSESPSVSEVESASESPSPSEPYGSHSASHSASASVSEAESASESASVSEAESVSESHSESASVSEAESRSESPSVSEAESASESASVSEVESASESPSVSEAQSASESHSESASVSEVESASESPSVSEVESASESASVSEAESASESPSVSEAESRSESPSASPSVSEAESASESTSPSPSGIIYRPRGLLMGVYRIERIA